MKPPRLKALRLRFAVAVGSLLAGRRAVPRLLAVLAGCAWLLMAITTARAEDYIIDWWDAGAGGTSSGGIYTVSGSIGQPDAGILSGGKFTLSGGFWSIVVPGQASATPPALAVFLTTTNTLVLSWPSSATGFFLEQCADLGLSDWFDSGPAPSDDGTSRSVILPSNLGTRFYRLKKRGP